MGETGRYCSTRVGYAAIVAATACKTYCQDQCPCRLVKDAMDSGVNNKNKPILTSNFNVITLMNGAWSLLLLGLHIMFANCSVAVLPLIL